MLLLQKKGYRVTGEISTVDPVVVRAEQAKTSYYPLVLILFYLIAAVGFYTH